MDNKINTINLTEEQIESLFRFVEKKSVHWYDLQIEVVDHLATGIENEMQADPGLSFDNALEKVYKGFGIFGFSEIVVEKQKYLSKAAKKRWVSELKNLFKWPEITVSILIISTIATISLLLRNSNLSFYFDIIITCIIAFPLFYLLKSQRGMKKKLLMLERSSFYVTAIPFLITVLFPSYRLMSPVVFTVLLSVVVFLELATYRMYSGVKKIAQTLYPSAF